MNLQELEKFRVSLLNDCKDQIQEMYDLLLLQPASNISHWLQRNLKVGKLHIVLLDKDSYFDASAGKYRYWRSLRITLGVLNTYKNELLFVQFKEDKPVFGSQEYIYNPDKWLGYALKGIQDQTPDISGMRKIKRIEELQAMLINKDPVPVLKND